ncbi:metallophosphoesterase [Nannocystis pusilla]|uniref:Metallophosphoesterase n=1 Tax=Nannocystis pusilla TaxID=889268 RepID=A0A9X3ET16_9BACT|nr:metallophosphoesterase [Nannocystis pusilla]MCY1009320.1 metallophosphoesterase [Nannocystis pusilla]
MTERLIVVSDLHLAIPGALNNFHAGAALAAFFVEQARRDTTLMLAGDVFDFLQVEGRSATLDGNSIPGLVEATFAAVAAETWGRDLFQALGDIVRAGGRCIVLPGNHDPEAAHPAFITQLRRRTGLAPDDQGLAVHVDGPWRTQLGRWEVVVSHGHRADVWNDIDPAAMRAVLAGGTLLLPAGSRLVLQVLNAFKQARDEAGELRFPFVDLLKPEVPAVPLLLLYLDRELAMQYLPAALGLRAEVLARSLVRALNGPTLGKDRPAAGSSPEDEMGEALARTYTDGQRRNPPRCADELLAWLKGGHAGVREGTLAVHGGMRARVLRAFLWLASRDGRFFIRSHCSKEDRAILAEHIPPGAPPRLVIAGHTHAAREVWQGPDHAYLNTGTWTDLLALPARVDDAALRQWIDALEHRTVPRVRHLTYAEVTPTTAELREYMGHALT